MQSALFFVHQKECFSVRDFPPEKRRLRSDSVVLLPHTKASTLLTPQMPDACEGLYFSVKISPPSSSFFMERPTRVLLPVFKNQPINKPYGRPEGFSYLNLFVSGQRESNYTGLKLQTITIDKFNKLTKGYSLAVSFVECESKLSCEKGEPW